MSHLWSQEHKTAWKEALDRGETRFEGPPCKVCGGTTRFTAPNRACVVCQQRRAVERHKQIPMKRIVRAAKWRAERDNLEFDLEWQEIKVPDRCPVFDTPMDTPSLDRIDNTKGYTKDNVKVISWEANRLKHRLTKEQVAALLSYMESSDEYSST